MPPVTTIPSEEKETVGDSPFKIINNDNLGPVGIVKGEAIFKPFGKDNKLKPNIMVYPTRRANGNLEETKNKQFTKSNGYLPHQIKNNNNNLKKNYSNSQGNLTNHMNSANKKEKEQIINDSGFDLNFTKTLDAKLRKLQKEEKSRSSSKLKNAIVEAPRKPFVTTVKKGEFLEPPPEYASLLGIKVDNKDDNNKLYAYASRPRILQNNRVSTAGSNNSGVHRSKCEAAAIAAAMIASGIAGFRDAANRAKRDINSNIRKETESAPPPYANLMFDRRVVRGNTYAQHPMPTGDGESQAARQAEARRRALARRRAKSQQNRAMRLRLMSPPPVSGRKHEKIQTEKYLEEIFDKAPEVDEFTQTDLMYDRPMSPIYIPVKTGIDVETQIYPGDLFDFDMEVQPILEVLVGKTIEQALIEVLEEEELAALREQQRRFIEIRASELAETQRLEEQERRLRAERDRRVKEHADGCKAQQETEERIAASVLTQGYLGDLLPQVLEGLNEAGFIFDNVKQDVDDTFMPWLMKEVAQEMENMVSSRDILTDIVKEILENRAEIYRAMNEDHGEITDREGDEEPIQDIALAQHQVLLESAGFERAEEK